MFYKEFKLELERFRHITTNLENEVNKLEKNARKMNRIEKLINVLIIAQLFILLRTI